MKALRFELSGKTAFFKKPDVNTYYYFTYSNIHKVALYGLIGAVLGLDGYQSQQGEEYPEFYQKLQHTKISIIPHNPSPNKKMQTFNNSVGYASKEQGGNLIVKEQWLENSAWTIYVKLDEDELSNQIATRFLENQFVYVPYLGKNDHPANITNVKIVDLKECSDSQQIDSLFIKEDFECVVDFDDLFNTENKFKYQEKLPYNLDHLHNQYEFRTFVQTNMKVESRGNSTIYTEGTNKITFF